jgi:hypothetical protein
LVVLAWDQEEMMIVALKRQDRKSDEAVRDFWTMSRRFYVITASVEKELLVGIWLCTKEHLRQHLPGGNMNKKFTNMKEFSRYEQAVAHWVAENSEDAPFYRRA